MWASMIWKQSITSGQSDLGTRSECMTKGSGA